MLEAIADRDYDVAIEPSQKELSRIDYKTQALIPFVFWGIDVSDFYAGNYLRGLGSLGVSVITCLVTTPIIVLVRLNQLSRGNYIDSHEKEIRQVVQIKKEDMSSCDQTVALMLSSFLGVFGAHQFYAGKPIKGMLMLCSFGGLGIWNLINIYQLATCGFKDGQGKTICPDYIKLSTTAS